MAQRIFATRFISTRLRAQLAPTPQRAQRLIAIRGRRSAASLPRNDGGCEAAPQGAIQSVCEGRSNVTEDQRIVILIGLVGAEPWIGTARGNELVLPDIGDPG